MALALKRLEINFSKKMDKHQKIEWYEVFKDLDFRFFCRTVREINKNNKFFPTIYEMREEVKKVLDAFEEFTEKEKTYNFKKNGIIPKWLGKAIKSEPIEVEEKAELENILKSFK